MGLKFGKTFALYEIVLESNCQMIINWLSKNAICFSDLYTILFNIVFPVFCFILFFGLM